MRRSANEVIKELETRIAQLENKSARPANVVDTVIKNMAYLHHFSSSHAILSVPSIDADYAFNVMYKHTALYNDYTLSQKKQGRMVEFTIKSDEWLAAHTALDALRAAKFTIVASEKTR